MCWWSMPEDRIVAYYQAALLVCPITQHRHLLWPPNFQCRLTAIAAMALPASLEWKTASLPPLSTASCCLARASPCHAARPRCAAIPPQVLVKWCNPAAAVVSMQAPALSDPGMPDSWNRDGREAPLPVVVVCGISMLQMGLKWVCILGGSRVMQSPLCCTGLRGLIAVLIVTAAH